VVFAYSVGFKPETARRIRFPNLLINLASLLSQQKFKNAIKEAETLYFSEYWLNRGFKS